MNAQRPAEATQAHTRILRAMLATEDCIAYWKSSASEATGAARVRLAFEQRWFGDKSESRVKTLMGDMALRFDAYPSLLAALRVWNPPRALAPWICHFHTQLADPIYRRFTGEFLPQRRQLGYSNIDREGVARWVQEQWPGRWSPATCLKFGSNMLATAFEAGLFKDKKDPRQLISPRPPALALEYVLYALREVAFEGTLLGAPYLRSVVKDSDALAGMLRGFDSVRLQSIGDIQDFEWRFASLMAWAQAQRAAESIRTVELGRTAGSGGNAA